MCLTIILHFDIFFSSLNENFDDSEVNFNPHYLLDLLNFKSMN